VSWKEGKCYLIPCNGGKALGWVNEKKKEMNDVVLYYIKITPDALKDTLDDAEFTESWVRDILHVFQRGLATNSPSEEDNHHTQGKEEESLLSDADYSTLNKLLPPLIKAKGL